ncbi:hypothetical protein [Embleya sp. NBC_00896]|uniref:hypothetical protein n=1 Tax=Embleya sp. NBC_00896 TaxID=2975961 RepID=UPI002F9070B1|nr:hypothetical protein OG928_35205 [Embleya sp. NBC_00896]
MTGPTVAADAADTKTDGNGADWIGRSDAGRRRIGQLARSQWVIENRVHYVRDTVFAEDASKIRTGHGPEYMATLRNLAVNTLRTAGHSNIAAGLREVSYAPFTRPLDLLGLP